MTGAAEGVVRSTAHNGCELTKEKRGVVPTIMLIYTYGLNVAGYCILSISLSLLVSFFMSDS